MAPSIRHWLVIVLLVSTGLVQAQELTTRDNEEVKLLAKRKIELGLNDLLNVLSLSDLGEAERNTLISESVAPGVNQLFTGKNAIVEDDINPVRAATGIVLDMPVETYLANFDLLYTKSAQSTVRFSDFTISDLKKSKSLYIKVFYTSLFTGKNSKIDKPYVTVRRVAELNAEQTGNKWSVIITRLAFMSHADSTDLTQNNVPLKEAITRRPIAATDSVATHPDSAQVAALPPPDPEQAKERAALDAFTKLLKDGEAALAADDLETAQKLFEQAKNNKPIESYTPELRLFKIRKLLDERTRNSVSDMKKRLDLSLRKRRYTEALALMQRITDQQPDSAGYDVPIKNLMGQARRKAELDERFAAGQYRDLVKEYSRIIDAERKDNRQAANKANSSDWLLGRGKCYTQLGDYKNALRDLNESLTLDYQNLDALESRADLYARIGDFPKAAADLSVYITVDPGNADMFSRRATYRIRTNRIAEATADYDEAIRISNQNPRYYLQRGRLFLQTNVCDKAGADFSEGINRNRRLPDLYFWRGLAFVCLKEYESAGTDFARAIELGLDAPSRTRIDSIATQFYTQSTQSLQARKLPEALTQLGTALVIKPDYADAWQAKGEIHSSVHEDRQAVDALTNAIRYQPTHAPGFYQRGVVLLRMGNASQAVSDFGQALSLQPMLYEAALGEARARVESRQYDKAQVTLTTLRGLRKQLEKRYPATFFADTYYLSGRCAYELKQYPAALEAFDDALSISKEWAAAYTERGRVYEALGKTDRAREDYDRATQLEPTVAAHYIPLALMLERRDKLDEALTEYARCQELDRDHELANVVALGRGRCLMARTKYLEALGELNKVGQYDGIECTDECLYLRTYALVRTGQLPDKVRVTGVPVTTASPENAPKIRYVLACAHLQAGDDAQALVQLEKALQLGLTKDFLKKDKLMDFVRKDFRKTAACTQLFNRYRL